MPEFDLQHAWQNIISSTMMVCTQSFYSSLLRFLSHAGWNNVALFVPRMNAKMGLYIKAWCAPRLQDQYWCPAGPYCQGMSRVWRWLVCLRLDLYIVLVASTRIIFSHTSYSTWENESRNSTVVASAAPGTPKRTSWSTTCRGHAQIQ